MKRFLILAATLLVPVSGFAQGLPPSMLQNGTRLKEGIASLNAQWKQQTGKPLLAASDLGDEDTGASDVKQISADGDDDDDDDDSEENKKKLKHQESLKEKRDKAQTGEDDFTPAKIGDRYKIPIGYIARATLEMTGNSDNPGPIKAMLTQPIYSIDRQHVLFPAGAVVVGKIVGPTAGQNQVINPRAMFLPTHIVRPDGGAMRIVGQDLLDRYGINGVGDKTNYHLFPMLAAAIGLGAVESVPQILSNITQKSNTFNEMSSNTGQYIQQGGQTTLQQYMSLRPTITVRAGRVPILIFFNHEQFAPIWREKDNFHLTNVNYAGGATP